MLSSYTEYSVRMREIRFARSLELGGCEARVRGYLEQLATRAHFDFSVLARYDPLKRLWWVEPQTLFWKSPVPRPLVALHNAASISGTLADCFRLLWLQPLPDPNHGGAQIRVGHTLMSEEQGRDAFAIFRGDILSVYRLDWSKLWGAIENRLMHDPEFWVSGFTREDAVNAAKVLKDVFPWEWVRRRYREAQNMVSPVGMWDAMDADRGFPAYLLARTAIACLCKDPGWNYLISLAEGFKYLRDFPKGLPLLRKIATEAGHLHQANFSGYLLKRGLLAEIEPTTGSGNAKHDLAAFAGNLVIDIEMKALTCANAARQVSREIVEKCRKLPTKPVRPVVFFVLLVESSIGNNHKTMSDQLSSITQEVFEHTTGVSSVVVGHMFVDSVGGPVKWSFDKFLANEHALHRIDETHLRAVFEPNWQRLTYPLLPIVFSYNLRGTASGKSANS
jgi:hypothetical protein